MIKSIVLALAVGLAIGKMFYQFQVRLVWKVILTLLVSGIGCLLIFIFPESLGEIGVFLLILGAFVLLSSAKGFADAASWRSCACYIMYLVALAFVNECREYVSQIGWNDYRESFVLPCLGYVIGGGVAALRPLGRGRIPALCSIIVLFFSIKAIKSGFAIVPAIIGCFIFLIAMVGWNFTVKKIMSHAVSGWYVLSTLLMLIVFFT